MKEQDLKTKPLTSLQKANSWIKETDELPSNQYLYYQLLKMTGNVNTFSDNIAKLIVGDAQIRDSIIEKARLSKAPFTRSKTYQVKQSIQRLGFNQIHDEVEIGFFKKYFQAVQVNQATHLAHLLRSMIRKALIAEFIAQLTNYKDPALAFITGLNYQVGQMVIGLRNPDIYSYIESRVEKGANLMETELSLLGFDSSELSVRMIQKWKLAPDLMEIAQNHQDLHRCRKTDKDLVNIISLASYIADYLKDTSNGIQSMWQFAEPYLASLDTAMTVEEWKKSMQALFLKIIAIEERVFCDND